MFLRIWRAQKRNPTNISMRQGKFSRICSNKSQQNSKSNWLQTTNFYCKLLLFVSTFLPATSLNVKKVLRPGKHFWKQVSISQSWQWRILSHFLTICKSYTTLFVFSLWNSKTIKRELGMLKRQNSFIT